MLRWVRNGIVRHRQDALDLIAQGILRITVKDMMFLREDAKDLGEFLRSVPSLWRCDDWLRIKSCIFTEFIKLDGINLGCVTIDNTQMVGASMCRANLEYARIIDSDMRFVTLTGAGMQSARIERGNVSGACFKDADMEDAVLVHVLMDATNFRGARGFIRRNVGETGDPPPLLPKK